MNDRASHACARPIPAVYSLAWAVLASSCGQPANDRAADQDTPPDAAFIDAMTTPACPPPPAPIVVPCDSPGDSPGDSPDADADADAIPAPSTTDGAERMTLERVDFDQLPGWSDDSHAQAVPPFLRSCERLAELTDDQPIGSGPYSGRARHWRRSCAAATRVPMGDDAAARAFFERHFTPFAAHGDDGTEGTMTGYYVQPFEAARQPSERYPFPIFARPDDLVSVQLSDFIDDGRSRRIWGRVDPETGVLEPFPERSVVRARGLDERRVLFWLSDPVAAMAVEIEGSGKAHLEDGTTLHVAFAGKNGLRGRRTSAIMGALRTMRDDQGDEPWRESDRERFFTITDPREAMVFFHIEEREGAIGTQDVILTPRRSVAVDRAVIALSTPVWIDTQAPTSGADPAEPWRHLLIAQDTGAAIVGSVRADIYFGDDAEAMAVGRRVKNPGRMWLLLPRGLRVPTGPSTRTGSAQE